MIGNGLKEYMKNLGASLVEFADLRNIDASLRQNMDYGIAFAIKIKPSIIAGIIDGPTEEYYDAYNEINKKLDHINLSCVEYIKNQGFSAIGQDSTYVTSNDNLSTPLPHKTVATRAGLGWIGKNALLITPKYGSAIRISSVLTNMLLITNNPINESKCGTCNKCVKACSAAAIKGMLWNVNLAREELIDPFKCRIKARELLNKKIGIESAICGKCIEVCPVTQLYIKNNVE